MPVVTVISSKTHGCSGTPSTCVSWPVPPGVLSVSRICCCWKDKKVFDVSLLFSTWLERVHCLERKSLYQCRHCSSTCTKGMPGFPCCRDTQDIKQPSARSPLTTGDPREAKADIFDFPIPSRNVDKAIKRKKKKSKVWHKVWKVISKMLEENERLRSRLLICRQFDGEGSDRIQRSQNGAYLDMDESIFGWV
ncbi:uncharacterized protein C5orf47 homolog isoform X1 [Vidua macroura]|uniref:uncharacterized protein C5orf47 homolog isoform X1 n=1 Tax=Vidua macroura TaxID=187451 RepID=UPI0023A8667A|nr:uncharacterized protein C5orf47 homolog isoform X1 [Vidua macroura]